jgi:hypothetical protein
MSTLVLSERPPRLWDEPGARAFREPDAPERDAPLGEPDAPDGDDNAPPNHGQDASPHARLTLADVLGAAWDGLAAGTTVACPVCHGELAPQGAGGRCRSCGTTLS